MKLPPMEWIERAIRIDSVTHHSNEEMARFLVPKLEEIGLKVEEQKVTENGESFTNIIACSHAPDAPDLLVMNTHLDTVSPGEEVAWTKTKGNPFRATRVRDRIYGLGTADVKLDFLCKLWAARNARPWKRPFALVGTYGEERGLVGAMQLLQSKKLRPRYAMVGEPSNLELIYAHKGHFICTVAVDLYVENVKFIEPPTTKRWKGKSAHSSTPDLGENALRKGLTDIFKRGFGVVRLDAGTDTTKIPESCEAELVAQQTPGTRTLFNLVRTLDDMARDLKKRRDTRFSPPTSTLSLNRAETRRTERGVECLLTFDLRSLPDVDLGRWRQRFVDAMDKISCRIVSMTHDEPLRGNKNGPFMQIASAALKSCAVTVVKKTKASSTEAALYNHFGAEAIVFGPGLSIGNVHRPNEYNSLRQMGIATQFYTNLLGVAPSGE